MFDVYHFVPHNLTGNILYPLNVLKDKHPDLYAAHARKYQGRQHLMTTKMPILDCLWNDVLHFSPVHPGTIRDALIKTGHRWQSTCWFVINTKTCNFTADNSIFYFPGKTPSWRHFKPFDTGKIAGMRNLTEETITYYEQCARDNKRPLLFAHIPHILYKGNIQLDIADRIQVD